MTEPQWLDRSIVLDIHAEQQALFGGADGVRDLGLLDSALGRPLNKFACGETGFAVLAAAYAAENWPEVDRLVNDDVVRRHAACGTPAQVKARLEEYRAFGLDEVIIGGADDVPSITAALAAARGERS